MKRLFVFLIAVLLVSSIAFAQGTTEGTDDEKIVLTGYMQIDPANVQYAGHNEIMEKYQADHPELEFKIEYASGEAFHQKFQSMAASKQIPDVFTCYGGARTAYIQDPGYVLDLNTTNFITDDFKSGFQDATFKTQGPNGELWMIPPSMAVCHAVYANNEILNKLGLEYPKTYKEMLDQIPVIKAAGYNVCSMGNKDPWVVNSWLLSLLVDRVCGPEWFMDAAHGRNGAKFTDPCFVRCLSLIKEMNDKGFFSPGVNQMSNGEASQEFYQEKSVYLINSGWASGPMDSDLSQERRNNTLMEVFPEIEGEVRHNSSTATTSEGFGISASLKGTKEAEAAWDFIKYYTGKEGATIRANYGEVPTYNVDPSQVKMETMQAKFAEFQETHPMGYVFDSVMNGEGVTILNQDIQAMMLGNGTPEEIAANYEKWVAANDTNRE